MGQYAGEHTKAWAAKIAEFDGFIFVSPSTTTPPPGY
jgi:NAD(P)H-dependent FMN reductase